MNCEKERKTLVIDTQKGELDFNQKGDRHTKEKK